MRRVFSSLLLGFVCSSALPVRLGAEELLPAGRSMPDAVDFYVNRGLKAANQQPVGQAAETALIRRLTLDLAGRIPAPVETREYTASKNPRKRRELIKRLMDSPEFVEQQSIRFDTFMSRGTGSIRKYLQTAFRENRHWDRIFRDVLIGNQTDPVEKEAAAFLKGRVKDLDKLTNDVSVVFFGVNVSCAKCHDHPLVDDWKQDHFFGMKSFFNRTYAAGKFIGERSKGTVSFKTANGVTKTAKLMFLTGTVIPEPVVKKGSTSKGRKKSKKRKRSRRGKNSKTPPAAPAFSRRKQLVEIALKPGENGFFARAIVNRVWYELLGYGLVMPLDQMHAANPASHPQLLKWLARDFVSHGYDLRRLIQGLVLSRAYSRGSRWRSNMRPKESLFAVAVIRPLTPTQLARSLSLATADHSSFGKKSLSPQDRQQRIQKAAAPTDAAKFEQPDDNFQVSAAEALFFSNSESIRKRYLTGGLVKRLQQMKDPGRIARTAVSAVLSRSATKMEIDVITRYLQSRGDRRAEACRQIVWSLLTGPEFRFNH